MEHKRRTFPGIKASLESAVSFAVGGKLIDRFGAPPLPAVLSCICAAALAGIRGRVAMGVCSPIASVTSTSLLSETHIRRHGTPKVTNQGKVRSFFLKASSLPSGPNSPPRACASTTYLPLSANTHKGTQPISYQRTTQKHYMYHP